MTSSASTCDQSRATCLGVNYSCVNNMTRLNRLFVKVMLPELLCVLIGSCAFSDLQICRSKCQQKDDAQICASEDATRVNRLRLQVFAELLEKTRAVVPGFLSLRLLRKLPPLPPIAPNCPNVQAKKTDDCWCEVCGFPLVDWGRTYLEGSD